MAIPCLHELGTMFKWAEPMSRSHKACNHRNIRVWSVDHRPPSRIPRFHRYRLSKKFLMIPLREICSMTLQRLPRERRLQMVGAHRLQMASAIKTLQAQWTDFLMTQNYQIRRGIRKQIRAVKNGLIHKPMAWHVGTCVKATLRKHQALEVSRPKTQPFHPLAHRLACRHQNLALLALPIFSTTLQLS